MTISGGGSVGSFGVNGDIHFAYTPTSVPVCWDANLHVVQGVSVVEASHSLMGKSLNEGETSDMLFEVRGMVFDLFALDNHVLFDRLLRQLLRL